MSTYSKNKSYKLKTWKTIIHIIIFYQGDHPTSLNILNQGINGQKFGFDKEEECSTCGELGAERKCSACKMVGLQIGE